MAQISTVLATHKKNKKGLCPIYLRIADTNSTKYISLKESISPSHWNENKSSVRKSHPRHDELNNLILKKTSYLNSLKTKLKTDGKPYNPSILKRRYNELNSQRKETENVKEANFFDYADKVIESFENQGKLFTYKRYKSTFKKLRAYCDNNLPYSKITVRLLRDYETHLIKEHKNSASTVETNFSAIRAILYKAIDEDLFPQEKNPFFKFSPSPSTNSANKKLSLDEIQRIENLELDRGTVIWNTRNYFLFSFYCAGIRFGDMAKMKNRNIINGRLKYTMSKTGTNKNVKLMPKALEILELYDKTDDPDEYLFPILDTSKKLDDIKVLHNDIASKNALINSYLKKIGKRVETETKISFHMARHSFADLARSKGWSIYDISKALGHKNIKVTERYLKKFDHEGLDSKMDSLFS